MKDESETPPVQAENSLLQPVPGVFIPGANNLERPRLAGRHRAADRLRDEAHERRDRVWNTGVAGVLTSITGYIAATDEVIQDFDSTCVSDLKRPRLQRSMRTPLFPLRLRCTRTAMQAYTAVHRRSCGSPPTSRSSSGRSSAAYYYEQQRSGSCSSRTTTSSWASSRDWAFRRILPVVINVQTSSLETESVAFFANVEIRHPREPHGLGGCAVHQRGLRASTAPVRRP